MNVRRSLFLSFAEKYSRMAIQLVSTMILSRLLTPHDIGVATIALAVVGLTHVVRDFGVSNYLIQERELTHERLRTTFGIVLITSWIMGIGLAAASRSISELYAEPGLHSVLLILTLNFCLIPFGSLALVVLRRDGHFGALYRINLVSAITYAAVALILASRGWGYLAMAWASVAGNMATASMALLHMPSHMRLVPSFSQWRRITSFGVLTVIANLIAELGTRATDLAIGRLIGISQTGLYSKADAVGTMFNDNILTAILGVAVPKFAEDHRSGQALRSGFLHYLVLITAIAWPFFVFSGIMMPYITNFLFGHQWAASAESGRILCVGQFINALAALNWAIITAMGAVRTNLSIQIPVQSAGIVFVVIGCYGGLDGVAVAVDIIAVIGVLISYSHLRRLIQVSLSDVLRATLRSLAITLVSAGPPLVTVLVVGNDNTRTFTVLCLAGSGSGIAWFLAVLAVKHPIADEIAAGVAILRRRLTASLPSLS